jgi:hypothetical protein
LSKFFPSEAAPELQIIHEIVKEPKAGIVFAPPIPQNLRFPMKIPLFSFVAIFALSGLATAAPDLKATAAKIDELILAKLAKEKIQPNAQASDEVFVRRVYLDVTGRIPRSRRPRISSPIRPPTSGRSSSTSCWPPMATRRTTSTTGQTSSACAHSSL